MGVLVMDRPAFFARRHRSSAPPPPARGPSSLPVIVARLCAAASLPAASRAHRVYCVYVVYTVDTYSKNLDAGENTKVVRKTKTTVGGRPAYRINYTVATQGATIPGLCYVTVNRGAALMLVWAIAPANSTKGQGALMRIMRGLKVKK